MWSEIKNQKKTNSNIIKIARVAVAGQPTSAGTLVLEKKCAMRTVEDAGTESTPMHHRSIQPPYHQPSADSNNNHDHHQDLESNFITHGPDHWPKCKFYHCHLSRAFAWASGDGERLTVTRQGFFDQQQRGHHGRLGTRNQNAATRLRPNKFSLAEVRVPSQHFFLVPSFFFLHHWLFSFTNSTAGMR